ncbi:MAG TPA: hypothetical protein PLB63_09895, partial [Planctomycetota bacterium]|nr:hypothetical protein [Planctomycetota bacterium]
ALGRQMLLWVREFALGRQMLLWGGICSEEAKVESCSGEGELEFALGSESCSGEGICSGEKNCFE